MNVHSMTKKQATKLLEFSHDDDLSIAYYICPICHDKAGTLQLFSDDAGEVDPYCSNNCDKRKIVKAISGDMKSKPAHNIVEISKDEPNDQGLASVDLNKQGRAINKRHNYDRILAGDIRFSDIRFEYDELGDLVFLTNAFWNTERHILSDEDLNEIQRIISEVYGLDNEVNIRNAVYGMAFRNKVHPLRDLLRDLEGTWDGVERLKDFFPRFLGAERSDYTTAVTKLMFFGAIQRIFVPGCKFDCCIVLKGRQGCGKSSLVRMLALNDQYFTDDLQTMDSSKIFERIQGKWIVELSEMLVSKTARYIEAIKGTLSRQQDVYRTPYATQAKTRPRQCIFIGTTNSTEFLPDDKTGNRRFFPIICEGQADVHPMKDPNETRRYILACYAEALAIGERDGFNLVLPTEFEDYVAELCEAATPEDPKIGLIQNYLDNECRDDYVCSRMIWDRVFDPGEKHALPKSYETRDISEIMNTKIEGWEKCSTSQSKWRFEKYGRQRAWHRISNNTGNNTGNNDGNTGASDNDFFPIDESGLEHPFD